MGTRYVLLTAAKDEEEYIGRVLECVLSQTLLPVAWFIVDDGSSDKTAAIIERMALQYPLIRLQSAGSRGGRNFGSQYKAIMAAYALAKSYDFEFVGVVDADQAPERKDYYESILQEFERNPKLGVASGFIYERANGKWKVRPENSDDSVAASAFFRRACFDQVGGYTPLYYGGSDWLIQIEAKMAGWEIKTRPDLHILHYRPTSSAGGIWRGRFRAGLMDASFGSDPVFQLLKCCRRVETHPVFLGSLVRFCGYLWWKLTSRKLLIQPEKVAFLRKEQRAKLWRWITSFGMHRAS
jgi:biofilm PGA synthesis N-glycosyltransferase PgaC